MTPTRQEMGMADEAAKVRSIPKLYYSPGMTGDEIVDWNASFGRITKQEAEILKRQP